MSNDVVTKVCKECGEELPITNFYTSKSSGGGYHNLCKPCYLARYSGKPKNISSYTPRELMAELHRRGYRGKLKIVQELEVDLSTCIK